MLAFSKRYLMLLFFLPLSVYAFDNFDCVGSHPFWKLSLTDKKFMFKQGNNTPISFSSVKPTPSENMSLEHMRIYRTKMNGENLIILIQNQSCTDGKSVDIFPYEGIIITTDKVYHGCCSKKLLITR